MPCENAAQSENYFEFIGEYSGVLDYVKEEFNTDCITVINQRFAIAYVPKNGRTSIYGQNYPYNTIPRCFGLMDTQMLEDVGVAQVRRSPLDLYGNGVLVGMIDTGIDYEHPAFRYEDGRFILSGIRQSRAARKIPSWDMAQNIPKNRSKKH